MLIVRSFACAMLLVFSFPVTLGAQETKSFVAPKIKNVRLDWCKHWGRQCGGPAAHLFCQQKGYKKAKQWSIDRNVGARRIQTLVFGDGRFCRGAQCSGFRSIICVKDLAPKIKVLPPDIVVKKPGKLKIPKKKQELVVKQPGKLTIPKKPKRKTSKLRLPCLAKPERCCPDTQKTTICRRLAEALLDIKIRSYVPPRFTVMGDHYPRDVNITFANHVADIDKSKHGIWRGCRFDPNRIKNKIRRGKSLWTQFVELGTAWLDQWSSAYGRAKTFVATNVAKGVCASVKNPSGCRGRVSGVVMGTINAGLASLGIPPDLPDLNQLRHEGIKYLASEAASQVVGEADELFEALPLSAEEREKLYQRVYDETYQALETELDKTLPDVKVKQSNPFTWGHIDPAYAPRNARLYIEVKIRAGKYGAYKRFNKLSHPKKRWPKLYLHDEMNLYQDVGPISLPKYIPASGFIIPVELKPDASLQIGKNIGQIKGTVITAGFLAKFGISDLVSKQINYQGWRGANKYPSEYDLYYSTGYAYRAYKFNLLSGYGDGPLYWQKGLSNTPGVVYDAKLGLGVRTDHYKKTARLKKYFGLIEPAPRCDGKATQIVAY